MNYDLRLLSRCVAGGDEDTPQLVAFLTQRADTFLGEQSFVYDEFRPET